MDNDAWTLCLFDTAGQEDYDKLRPLSYPQTDVLLVCFSVVNPTSFENVQEKWIPELKRYCPGVPILLVGTQSDLRADPATLTKLARSKSVPVTVAEAERLVKREKAVAYVECSAKTLKNVKQVFDEALVAVVCPAEGKKACAIF